MRKWNAIITAVMTLLFLTHAVAGALELIGLYSGINTFVSRVAWLLLGSIVLHMLIGIRLTVDTLRACRRAGVSYFKENKLFWARRISGLAIVLFMIFHIVIFSGRESGGAYRLSYYGIAELATQILLVLSIALHVLANVKPSLIAFGIRGLKEYTADLLIALCIFLIFIGVGFVVYYMRWRA